MCIDIQYEWDGFSSCRRPIHKWLLLSYGLVVLSRLVHVAGALMCLGRPQGVLEGVLEGVFGEAAYEDLPCFGQESFIEDALVTVSLKKKVCFI